MTPEERRKRLEERMANMTPEERERFQARMREREAAGGGRGNSSGRSGGRQNANQPLRTTVERAQSPGMATATTIDSLFGPLPDVESRGMAWLYIDRQLKPVRLRLGITDSTWTEVKNESEFQPGQEVVISMTTGLEPRTTPGQGGNQNPLMGPQRGGRGGRGR
jgi:hypothetical protein